MLCRLCQLREANKANTHYLTDAVIRPCLNFDGGNDREKGLYFNLSSPGNVEMNFQRNTSMALLRAELGREPTEEEIERAKINPYSSDYIFCDRCERHFTEIENDYLSKELPKFRRQDPVTEVSIDLDNVRLARAFWLMQWWRSSVCVPLLAVDPDVVEKLRNLILLWKTVPLNELTEFPLSVTYLNTAGEPATRTNNLVGFMNRKNPAVIFMCDHVLLAFEHADQNAQDEIFGLSAPDFTDFINKNESRFRIRIFSDDKRRMFLRAFYADQARQKLEHYVEKLGVLWLGLFGSDIPMRTVQKFIEELVHNPDDDILHYSKENITRITAAFILRNAPM